MASKRSRRGQRILSARKAAQWDEERIRRFEEDQRRKREYISFVEIAEWYSDLAGPVSPKKAAALHEQAYRMLESDLLERRFEEDDRFVLFLHPGVSLTHRKMTAKRYQEARENNLDNEQGRSYLRLAGCRDLFSKIGARGITCRNHRRVSNLLKTAGPAFRLTSVRIFIRSLPSLPSLPTGADDHQQ